MVRSHPQYIKYEVWIDSKVVCLWFTKSSVSAAELNLELKNSSKIYQNKPKFYKCCALTPNGHNMKLQFIRRWFTCSSLRVVFLRHNWIIIQILTNLSLSLDLFFNLSLRVALETIRRWNITPYFFFCLDDADTKNKKMNANTGKLKGTLKKQK
jgi:hypothetical protein